MIQEPQEFRRKMDEDQDYCGEHHHTEIRQGS